MRKAIHACLKWKGLVLKAQKVPFHLPGIVAFPSVYPHPEFLPLSPEPGPGLASASTTLHSAPVSVWRAGQGFRGLKSLSLALLMCPFAINAATAPPLPPVKAFPRGPLHQEPPASALREGTNRTAAKKLQQQSIYLEKKA